VDGNLAEIAAVNSTRPAPEPAYKPASEEKMRGKIIASAVLVLATGYGAAVAQTNAPAINETPTVTKTPSGPGAPVTAPSNPSVHNPTINPGAAGTQNNRERYGSSNHHVEHSGSQTIDANTHPLKAAKENRRLRKQQRANQTGFPPPR
jgi:hypothetical protein